MAKKTIVDNLYGKITLKNEDYWLLNDKLKVKVVNKDILVNVEIDVFDIKYEKFLLGLYEEELMQYFRNNPQKIKSEEVEKIKKQQKELYKKYLVDNIAKTVNNIEEAALEKRAEMIEGETVESFSRIVGKEKAQRVFDAKTREEKLESLELKRLRVMSDNIEITCTCDWFKPSGGFVIFQDGSVEMFYVDSMSI